MAVGRAVGRALSGAALAPGPCLGRLMGSHCSTAVRADTVHHNGINVFAHGCSKSRAGRSSSSTPACRLSPVARRPSPDSRHGSGVPCEGAAHDRDDVRPQHTNPVSQHRLSAARCRCPLPLGHRLWSAALSLGTSDEGRGRGRSAGRLHFQVTAVGAKFIELVPLIKLHHVPALTCRIPTHSEMLAPGQPASTEFHARP